MLRLLLRVLLVLMLVGTLCDSKRRKPTPSADAAAALPHLPTPIDSQGSREMVTQVMAAGEDGAKADPQRQLRLYRAAAERVRTMVEHEPMLDLLGATAKLARRVKQHGVALQCHREMLSLRGQAGAIPESYLVLWTEMATDLHLDGKYVEALRTLDQADDQLRDALTDEGLSLMHKQRAFLRDCGGEYAAAASEMERARLLAPQTADRVAHLDDVLRHRTVLTRMAAAGSIEGSAVTAELEAVRSQVAEMGDYLVHHGPWETALQLPHTYVPSVTARPWHDASGADFPQLRPLLALLREAAPGLKKEYRKLKRKKLLLPDEDCIQRNQGGRWHVSTQPPTCSTGGGQLRERSRCVCAQSTC